MVLLTSLTLAASADAESWTPTELPPPPAGWSASPRAINDRGQIVGDYVNVADGWFDTQAFLFDGAAWRDLGTLGGPSSWATAINDHGAVTGHADTARATECYPSWDGGTFCIHEQHAFVWRDGALSDLGTVGSHSSAYGINDAGHVIGSDGSFAQRWVRAGAVDVFGTFGGSCLFSSASAVNARGQVVGYASTATGSHAFLWDPRTGLVDLETLGGPTSWATAVSDAGHVVGVSETSTVISCETNEWGTFCSYEMHAFLWKDGVMTDLGTLGGPHATARGVNARGEIVGESDTAEKLYCWDEGGERCAYRVHAFVWADGVMHDLGETGLYSFATAINDQGDIVGSAQRPDRSSRVVVWRR